MRRPAGTEKIAMTEIEQQDPQSLLSAWQADPTDRDAFMRFLSSLNAKRQFPLMLDAVELYSKHAEVDPEILTFIGAKAVECDIPELAIKFFNRSLRENPKQVIAYAGLINALYKMSRGDEGIAAFRRALSNGVFHVDYLKEVGWIYMRLKNDRAKAEKYFRAAETMGNNSAALLDSLAEIERSNPDKSVPIALYRRAIAQKPGDPQLHLNFAIFLLSNGFLEEGWREYRWRMHVDLGPRRGVLYNPDLPGWDGEALAGKSVFLIAEQGIGDEIMFGFLLHWLVPEAERVAIGVDPRLVPIFQRTFPDALVGAFKDRVVNQVRSRSVPRVEHAHFNGQWPIDHTLPIAAPAELYWQRSDALPEWPAGYLTPDPERVAAFRDRLDLPDERLRVGLAWRSGFMHVERGRYFNPDRLEALIAVPNVQFFSLQYSADDAEIHRLQELAGDRFTVFDDVDLREDIEANLAILAHMDLVIGPPVSTLMMSLAVGRPTWMLTGTPWYFLGHPPPEPPHIPHLRTVRGGPAKCVDPLQTVLETWHRDGTLPDAFREFQVTTFRTHATR